MKWDLVNSDRINIITTYHNITLIKDGENWKDQDDKLKLITSYQIEDYLDIVERAGCVVIPFKYEEVKTNENEEEQFTEAYSKFCKARRIEISNIHGLVYEVYERDLLGWRCVIFGAPKRYGRTEEMLKHCMYHELKYGSSIKMTDAFGEEVNVNYTELISN